VGPRDRGTAGRGDRGTTGPGSRVSGAARDLAAIGRRFYGRGWVLGTSGNFSAVLSDRPLRLAITPTSAHKGRLRSSDFITVDHEGRTIGRTRSRPSAETRLHLEIVGARGARAVLHTHSVWGTMLSDLHAGQQGLALEGFEMLKGLSGVTTHEHRVWVPILGNDQDMARLASQVRSLLAAQPGAQAFLLRGHGLYTWGRSIGEAERHVEILEFLFEVTGRRNGHGDRHHP
jgi:methylthioribulose-1-phosphate dehydratase